MHSSRMRTGRALTVSRGGAAVPAWRRRGGLPGGGGVPAWRGGVPAWRGGACLEGRGCLPGGGVPGQVPPPVNRMTDRCKNITLAKTSFRPVKTDMSLSDLALSSFFSTFSGTDRQRTRRVLSILIWLFIWF